MADIERRIQQIKKMRFPFLGSGPYKANQGPGPGGGKGEWSMTGQFKRMGITIAVNHVTVNIQGGAGSWQGKGSTVDAAIAEALMKLQAHAKKLGI